MTYDLEGNWYKGLAFDLHTLTSKYLGEDEFGNAQFDNQRTEMGELVYQLKYNGDKSAVTRIVKLLGKMTVFKKCDYIIPVPATNKDRPYLPVDLIATTIGERYGVKSLLDYLVNQGDIQLKDVTDPSIREELLRKALKIVGTTSIENKKVLLLDDLYRSGSTLTVATDLLYNEGKAQQVYVLTMTKTRSNR